MRCKLVCHSCVPLSGKPSPQEQEVVISLNFTSKTYTTKGAAMNQSCPSDLSAVCGPSWWLGAGILCTDGQREPCLRSEFLGDGQSTSKGLLGKPYAGVVQGGGVPGLPRNPNLPTPSLLGIL